VFGPLPFDALDRSGELFNGASPGPAGHGAGAFAAHFRCCAGVIRKVDSWHSIIVLAPSVSCVFKCCKVTAAPAKPSTKARSMARSADQSHRDHFRYRRQGDRMLAARKQLRLGCLVRAAIETQLKWALISRKLPWVIAAHAPRAVTRPPRRRGA
jgi:hypothetical protein